MPGENFTISNEFGTCEIDASQVMDLLERALWIADDLRKHQEDPLNMDWMDDAESIADLIDYTPLADDVDVDDGEFSEFQTVSPDL